jgi:hypothetical protein
MGNRCSWEKAHSPYWSLRVEACRRNRSRAEYCHRDGLETKTFARWMKHIIGVDKPANIRKELRALRRKRQDRHALARRRPFWAMHVERNARGRWAAEEDGGGLAPLRRICWFFTA